MEVSKANLSLRHIRINQALIDLQWKVYLQEAVRREACQAFGCIGGNVCERRLTIIS